MDFFGRPPDSIECWRKPHKNWMKLKCEEKEERAMLDWKEFTQYISDAMEDELN